MKLNSYDWLWLSLALFPLLFIALLLPLTPHDYWWYLRLGQETMETGFVPSIETYSFTQAGKSIVNQPWLSAIIFWITYASGGLALTFLLRALIIGVTYGLLWVWIRQLGAGRRLTSLLVLLAGLAGSNNWSFRPQLLGYLFFALTLLFLWHWHKENSKFIWILPVIACLWVNIHGSFLLIFLLGGAAFLFGQGNRKDLFIVLIITFLATLISPYGLVNWKEILGSYFLPTQAFSGEWGPPVNRGWQMNLFFGWVLLLAPLAAFSSRRLSMLEWVWLLGLVWMSLSGIRYVVWGLFLLAAVTGNLLAEWGIRWLDRPAEESKPGFNFALSVFLLILPLLALPGLRPSFGVQFPPVISPDTPVEATDWLAQHPELPGPLWSDMTFSSYLIFALPSRQVWIDTRFEMIYQVEQYQRYIEIVRAAPNWQVLLDEEGLNLLMISIGGEPWFLKGVESSAQWCEQYRDSTAAIFSRRLAAQTCP